MKLRGAEQPRFEGLQRLVTVAELEVFVARAGRNERLVYCEAPRLILGPTADRARALAQQGLVTTHQERRAGGGFNFFVQRTGKVAGQVGEGPATSHRQGMNGNDDAADVIRRLLARAANMEQRCPSDAELASAVARELGLAAFTRDQAQARIRKLIDRQVIRSTVAVEGGVPTRVVTIVATGKRTALPEKWAALDAARKAGAK